MKRWIEIFFWLQEQRKCGKQKLAFKDDDDDDYDNDAFYIKCFTVKILFPWFFWLMLLWSLVTSLSLSHSYGPWTREYFEDVDQTWETFEKILWGHISNFYKLSKERYIFFVLIWKNLRFVIALIPYEIHFISCTQL